jgi:hypothetical protein
MVVELPSFVKLGESGPAAGYVILSPSGMSSHSARVAVPKQRTSSKAWSHPLRDLGSIESTHGSEDPESLKRELLKRDRVIDHLRVKIQNLRVCQRRK